MFKIVSLVVGTLVTCLVLCPVASATTIAEAYSCHEGLEEGLHQYIMVKRLVLWLTKHQDQEQRSVEIIN